MMCYHLQINQKNSLDHPNVLSNVDLAMVSNWYREKTQPLELRGQGVRVKGLGLRG